MTIRVALSIIAVSAALGLHTSRASAESESCGIDGPFNMLVAGATTQTLRVVFDDDRCVIQSDDGTALKVGAPIQASIRTNDAGTLAIPLHGTTIVGIEADKKIVVVTLSEIPDVSAQLQAGPITLTLGAPAASPKQRWGRRVQLTAPIRPHGALRVSYSDPLLDGSQVSSVARGNATDGYVAVVNARVSGWLLESTLRAEVKDAKADLEEATKQAEEADRQVEKAGNLDAVSRRQENAKRLLRKKEKGLKGFRSGKVSAWEVPERLENTLALAIPGALAALPEGYRWRLDSWSWGDDVQFLCKDGQGNDSWSANPCLLGDPHQVTFAVFETERQPLRVTLELWRGNERVLVTGLILARESSEESLPLPIRDLISIQCAGETPRRDPLVVARAGAVSNRECKVRLEFHRYRDLAALSLFGPQIIAVTTSRGKATGKTIERRIDPRQKKTTSISIAPPDDDEGGSGLYQVEVRIMAARRNGGVVYRGEPSETQTTVEDVNFVARFEIRQVGPYAVHIGHWYLLWQTPRFFVTIPVELAGLRFPAYAPELTSSSQPRSVQQVNLKTGILFGIEPWDYERNAAKYPLNPRLLVGFHLAQLGENRFDPSFVAGIAGTFPLIDNPASVTATSIALGVHYERKLSREGGNHVLFTFGLNVFSFLNTI